MLLIVMGYLYVKGGDILLDFECNLVIGGEDVILVSIFID